MRKSFINFICFSIIILMAGCGGSESSHSSTSDDSNDDPNGGFEKTSTTYTINDDMDNICQQTFGNEYRLADWLDIESAYDSGVSTDYIMLEGSAFVSNNGDEFWSGDRHYIVTRHNHNPSDGYLSHDNIDDHLFDLGSWYTNYSILCYSDDGGTDVITEEDLSGQWRITISGSDQVTTSNYYIDVTLNQNGTLTYTEYLSGSYYDDGNGTWSYDESSGIFYAVGEGDMCDGPISSDATVDEFSVSGTFYGENSVTYNWVRNSTVVYSESFSSDPGYNTHISSNMTGNCSLEWSNGIYYAQVSDHSAAWYCVAESPTFNTINASDSFRIEFDFNPVTPDWGQYPGIYFADSASVQSFPTETSQRALSFSINWADGCYKKFNLRGNSGSVLSDTIPADNEFYHVVIAKDGVTGDLNWTVTREDGSIFVDLSELDIEVGSFDQLFIGEVQGPTKYGDSAEIRVDNIKIQ
jgi:hypothetical protein